MLSNRDSNGIVGADTGARPGGLGILFPTQAGPHVCPYKSVIDSIALAGVLSETTRGARGYGLAAWVGSTVWVSWGSSDGCGVCVSPGSSVRVGGGCVGWGCEVAVGTDVPVGGGLL